MPTTLLQRIERAVQTEASRLTQNIFDSPLAILAGNGLTRSAVGISKGGDYSWEKWLEQCVQDAREENPEQGQEVTASYLRSLGYNSAEIFEYALVRAPKAKRKMWQRLWNATTEAVRPTALHEALVDFGEPILTTNYDDLLEQAFLSRRIVAKSPTASPVVWSILDHSEGPGQFPQSGREPQVYKLHGGFYRPDETFDFKRWYDRAAPWTDEIEPGEDGLGPRHTIANRHTMKRLPLATSAIFSATSGR